jgi:hypothetical protein
MEFTGFKPIPFQIICSSSKELRINILLLLLSLTFLILTLLNQTKKCCERRSYKSLKNCKQERKYANREKTCYFKEEVMLCEIA